MSTPANPRRPRSWSNDRIYFILCLVNDHSTTQIVDLFNSQFGTGTINYDSVRYIRLTYGTDPLWGSVWNPGQRVRTNQNPSVTQRAGPGNAVASMNSYGLHHPQQPPQPPQMSTSAASTDIQRGVPTQQISSAVQSRAAQATAEMPQAQSGDSKHGPSRDRPSVYPPPPLFNFASFKELEDKPDEDQDIENTEWTPINNTVFTRGTWYQGCHDGCNLDGAHRHEMNGGVFFSSVAAVTQLIGRMGHCKDCPTE